MRSAVAPSASPPHIGTDPDAARAFLNGIAEGSAVPEPLAAQVLNSCDSNHASLWASIIRAWNSGVEATASADADGAAANRLAAREFLYTLSGTGM